MLLLLSSGRLTWSSDSQSGLLRFVRITRLKVNFNWWKINFCVMGIPRKLLLTLLTKLLISLGITSGHLAFLNVQFMLDFFGLDLLASWLLISFLPLLHAVIIRLLFERSLQLELHFAQFIRMCSLSSNKAIYFSKFQCCNATYIGRTSQCLVVRVKHHVPRNIRNHSTFEDSKLLHSAICEHLNALHSCVVNYSDECVCGLT